MTINFDLNLVQQFNELKAENEMNQRLLCVVITESGVCLDTKEPGQYLPCQLDGTGIAPTCKFEIDPEAVKAFMQYADTIPKNFSEMEIDEKVELQNKLTDQIEGLFRCNDF